MATTIKPQAPLSLKLSPDLVRQLDKISRDEVRSRSSTIRLALIEFIDRRQKRKTRKA